MEEDSPSPLFYPQLKVGRGLSGRRPSAPPTQASAVEGDDRWMPQRNYSATMPTTHGP